jgi:hypothetical protein
MGDSSKGIAFEFKTYSVQEMTYLPTRLNMKYNPLEGEFLRPNSAEGPIIWELHRPEIDKMFVEANILISIFLQCHNNTSIITSQDVAEAVEEYAAAYMTKEGAPLRQAAATLLAAVDHICKNVSKASDSGTIQRTGKHLAQRTLNSFAGSHQWSLPLMVYALLGHKSYNTTESFIYLFPHANVAHFHTQLQEKEQDQETTTDDNTNCPDQEGSDGMATCEQILNDVEEFTLVGESQVQATPFKVNDKCIFLTQAESYANRGTNFHPYSQLEFESIVELLPRKTTESTRGRRPRIGFDLGEGHPLYASHQGFIRTKMRTPILAGKPPPRFPGNMPPLTTGSSQPTEHELNNWEKTWIAMPSL